jgi:hypothetical protein
LNGAGGHAVSFPQLEIQDAGQEAQTNAISYYNDRVSEEATVRDPQSNSGGKNQEHR